MKEISRHKAIENIRGALWDLVGEKESVCKVVADRGVFCGGFAHWSFEDLQERFEWYVRRHPGVDRERLEHLADVWQQCRQHRPSGRLPCDVPPRRRRIAPCAGWDDFYEDDLARFHEELCGETVKVVPDELVQG